MPSRAGEIEDESYGPLPENDPWLMLLAQQVDPKPRWIRATHRYGFRSGKWALLLGTQVVSVGRSQRLCWQVVFEDGTADLWPTIDEWDHYEFATQTEKPDDD